MLMILSQVKNGNYIFNVMLKQAQKDLLIKEMELDALLEITKAINRNESEEGLYSIFHFTLRSKMDIDAASLYVFEGNSWSCKANYGFERPFKSEIIEEELSGIQNITILDKSKKSQIAKIFEAVVPVKHKEKILAYVLISVVGDEEELAIKLLPFVQSISNIILVAIENKRLAKKELLQQAAKKELEIARNVQNMLFPKKLADTEILKIKAAYYPHNEVGGDYYDYIKLDKNRFVLCIADVSGKGVPAAMLMSNFQASFRALLSVNLGLVDVVKGANALLLNNSRGEYFITFFSILIDLEQKTIQYINAGHNPPVLIKDGKVLFLDKGTTILGMFDFLPSIELGELSFEKNLFLFAYTDGLSEVRNENGEEFGDEQIKYHLLKSLNLEHADIPMALKLAADEFRANLPYTDDVTMLSCDVNL